VLIRSKYMDILREKQSKNCRKTKSHTKTEETVALLGRTAVRPGRTTVRPSTSVPMLPQRYILTSFGPRFWPWIFTFWAYFATLFDLHASTSFSLDSTHTFLLKTWLESYKSAINTQQAKTSVIGEIGV